MRCLIRNITRKRSGITHEDKPFSGDHITIGRAAANQIFLSDLRVALNHARVSQTPDGKFQIQALALSGIRINGATTGVGIINAGDVISIGSCRIEVVKPPLEGFDLCLEVEQPKTGAEDTATLQSRSRIGLENTGLRKRMWSWVLAVTLFTVFLVAPMAGFLVEDLREPLRATGMLSDQMWDTGRLANVHQFIGQDCNACHKKAFVRVEDEACVECHREVPVHADPVHYPVEELTATRCGSCHKEHNAPSSLSRLNDPLCVDCHSSIRDFAPNTELLPVGDFEEHPQFQATLFKDNSAASSGDAQSDSNTIRVSLDDKANLVERSGVRFDHKVHLAAGGINAPAGKRVLDCGSCHQLEPGGTGLAPVNMETMCQDCHRLEFDPNDPARQMPHADIATVTHTLREYYAARALEGGYLEKKQWQSEARAAPDKARTRTDPEPPETVRKRRRPAQELTESERKQALEWAQEKFAFVAEEMFEFRACTTCHIVSRENIQPPSWTLAPVKIADRWLPKGLFPHIKHRTTPCATCHAATASEKSEDVLLPGIESCMECHGGPDVHNQLASQCVDCHKFHILDTHFMGNPKNMGQDMDKSQAMGGGQ